MTVETQTKEINASTNGSATSFSFSPIVIFKTSEIVVTAIVDDTGAETLLIEGTGSTNYSVTVSSFPGTGSITYPATGSAVASGTTLNMKRVLVLEKTTDLENQGGYFPDTIEEELDRMAMRDLQQQEEIDRSFQAATGETVLTTLKLPNSSTVTSGSAANLGLSSDHTTLEFGVSAGTLPDPVTIVRGGTGAITAAAALAALLYGVKGGDIASASPIVIDTDGDYFDVTGTTGFSVMTVVADRRFTLQFDGALTMTHHATNLDLPGEADILTAAGDVGVFQSTGTDTVQCISYFKANAAPPNIQRWTKGGDIASASPLVLDDDGNYFDVTGTTGFSQITSTAGNFFILQFDGVLTMTHNGTTLDLPGEANITTAAGDVGVFFSTGTNTVQCVSYTRADGTAVISTAAGFTLGTEQSTTSGTSVTFSSIPAGTTMIVIMFEGVSLTADTAIDITIGDSGGLETSGYLSNSGMIRDGSAIAVSESTAEFIFENDGTTGAIHGAMTLSLKDSTNFTWVESHTAKVGTQIAFVGGGSKSLSAELTQLQITGGTFDAGSINIMYQ